MKSFLHVSDLHVSTTTLEDEEPVPDVPVLGGLRGHSHSAVMDLIDFYEQLRANAPVAPHLIATGDVTRCGQREEFKKYEEFFDPITRSAFVMAIPGNHDQWPGAVWWPLGEAATPYPHHLAGCPSIVPIDLGDDNVRINFVKLDSSTDVSPSSRERLFATGKFLSQLEAVDKTLFHMRHKGGTSRVATILVIHHSVIGQDRMIGGIARDTHDFLRSFIATHNVKLVLSGHLHSPFFGSVSRYVARSDGDVVECRCGTTSQNRARPANTILVHEIKVFNGAYVWLSKIYWRSVLCGFTSYSNESYDGGVLLISA